MLVCLDLAWAFYVRRTKAAIKNLRLQLRDHQLQEHAEINGCCCAIQRADNKNLLLKAFSQFVEIGPEVTDYPARLAEFMSMKKLAEVQHMRNIFVLDKVLKSSDER